MNRFVLVAFFFVNIVFGQVSLDLNRLNWLPESHKFWVNYGGDLVIYNADELDKKTVFLTKEQLKVIGFEGRIESIVWNTKQDKILIYTHSQRVWRANTKGDYWFVDLKTKKGRQIGQGLDKASLMFAKFSSDGNSIAYVSKHNIYTEDVTSGVITQLTFDGNDKIINGTFDWVYEEELMARDGFRWSPDGTQIAFWRVDATETKFHLMINNTDALYPFTVPVEYPKAGEKPSAVKLGVITLADKKVNWLKIPGEADNNYLPRMQWLDSTELMVVQLNRKQNQVALYRCNSNSGLANKIYQESSNTWIDVFDSSAGKYDGFPCVFVDSGKSFLWSSETDGWMHIYKISIDGKKKELVTKVNFDTYFLAYNKNIKSIYHLSSPTDATQRYLYETNLNTKKTKRLTPQVFDGTNTYSFSSDALYAVHFNSNINRNSNSRLLSLEGHKKIFPKEIDFFVTPKRNFSLEKFKVTTADGVELDGIMAKPLNFDATKKYPLFFYVYGEPAASVANDVPYFNGFISNLIPQGYIGIALDNRGTPIMKGAEWRKSIYKNIGIINTRDQAMAAKEILKWHFIDTTRVAVHGWSGGGAVTLNLLFQYPEIYKTGIAIAAVTDQHFYDNIYTERYMGLPSENEEAYIKASPVTHAKKLKGNLLYIHGTGDDNVHYKNAEVLINELIKQDKVFDLMIYPNRSHSINEGSGTRKHLTDTFMKFIFEYCPPGAK
ncbi:dipeptidyl-peptidase-4 [Flavobacterium glycines]|uniref:Dipeptidyl-peptidase-4 n=1 Tax=Flavobacterium glycines TaxID=551990 RepID=A0A1B9DS07_9FLAO|nr:DPP IV N-terminal domain-containing protein [Flavobacterium glycines]OCB72480.1 peptidase S9 [Flavobacterium glycines]GEL09972.1 peptidase S9 [Flavobacterium glycines]SDI86522.1 dipeptidyl-peptidase-4 [Flavobacterium glycines]